MKANWTIPILLAAAPAAAADTDALPPDFLVAARHAELAATGTVVRLQAPRPRAPEPPTPWHVHVRPGTILYGRGQTDALVYTSTEAPKLSKGDKILLVGEERRGPAARQAEQPQGPVVRKLIRWSPQRERALREALAPGWEWQRGYFGCPWCRHKPLTQDVGTCAACGARTASGTFKLCPRCAPRRGACMMCRRTIGPATRGVSLNLSTISPRIHRPDPRQIIVEPGKDVRLWVRISGDARPAPEFQCVGGNENLAGCRTLFFLVRPPGANAKTRAVGFELREPAATPTPPGGATPAPPKTEALARPVSARLKLKRVGLDGRAVFDTPGAYVVRAAAGRQVSYPVTVVVADKPPGGETPRPPPPGGGTVPVWTPGGNTVRAERDGKAIWMLRVGFPIGSVQVSGGEWIIRSADGTTTMTVDAATGRALSLDRR